MSHLTVGDYVIDTKNFLAYKGGIGIPESEYKQVINLLFEIKDPSRKYYGLALKFRELYTYVGKLAAPLKFPIKRLTLGSIHELCDLKYYDIDFDVFLPTIKGGVNLQRDFCWTLDQKREFIKSWVKESHIPPITCIIIDNKKLEIIDGKQRLSTLISFYGNEFSLESGEYYSDLDWLSKSLYKNKTIDADITYTSSGMNVLSDIDKIEWFKRVNFTGTPQDIDYMKKFED